MAALKTQHSYLQNIVYLSVCSSGMQVLLSISSTSPGLRQLSFKNDVVKEMETHKKPKSIKKRFPSPGSFVGVDFSFSFFFFNVICPPTPLSCHKIGGRKASIDHTWEYVHVA